MKPVFFLLSAVFTSLSVCAATYSQPCRAIGDDYLQFKILTGVLEPGAELSVLITAFEDRECKTPYLRFNQYFRVGSREGEKLDLRTLKVTYTALSDEVAEALNYSQYCGVNQWKRGDENAVTGRQCDEYQQLAVDDIYYQILKTEGDSLSFGEITETLDGAAKKPVR